LTATRGRDEEWRREEEAVAGAVFMQRELRRRKKSAFARFLGKNIAGLESAPVCVRQVEYEGLRNVRPAVVFMRLRMNR